MRNPQKCLLGIASVAIWTALAAGCVDAEPTGPGGSGGTGASTTGPGGTGGEAGQGGETGQGGTGGTGGTGGVTPASLTRGTEFASAGGEVKSSKFKMRFTFGQPTSDHGKSTSESYRFQGGLVGAYGSEK